MYDWYAIFDYDAFLAEDRVQKTLTLLLAGRGQFTLNIFKGNYVTVFVDPDTDDDDDDAFLPVNFLDQNPYVQNGYAIYKDGSTIYLGFEVEE